MYTVKLIPTQKHNSKILAKNAERCIIESEGSYEETKDEVVSQAKLFLEKYGFKDEIDKYYTISAREVD